jgi:hypothetical protein
MGQPPTFLQNKGWSLSQEKTPRMESKTRLTKAVATKELGLWLIRPRGNGFFKEKRAPVQQ